MYKGEPLTRLQGGPLRDDVKCYNNWIQICVCVCVGLDKNEFDDEAEPDERVTRIDLVD